MTEFIHRQATPVAQTDIPYSPMVEFGAYYKDITDPGLLFRYDKRIERYETLPALGGIEIPKTPLVTGLDWHERLEDGHTHRLRGVFHYRGVNYGIADTTIDGKNFTYVTRFGEQGESGQIVYMLDDDDKEVHMYDPSDRIEGEQSTLLTLRRTDNGKLQLINESVWPVEVGLGRPDPEHAEKEQGGFSLRNAYRGIKKALGWGKSQADHRHWDSDLTGNVTSWKPDAFVPAQWIRWKREQTQQTVES